MIKLLNYEQKICTLGNWDFLQIVEVQQEIKWATHHSEYDYERIECGNDS